MARVYQTFDRSEAHIRAAIVDQPGWADLCVHRVESWGQAVGDGLWYITRAREDATVRVYFGSVGEAEVRICFVDTYSAAGWQRAHRLKGRLG